MNLRIAILTAATLLTIGAAAGRAVAAVVIHVAPHGDDAHDGSAAAPLRSLAAAQRRVAAAQAGDAGPVRVEIAAGEYLLAAPLVFAPADSGRSAEAPVIYTAVGGEVVVSGGAPLSPWRVEGDHWIADVPRTTGGERPLSFRDLWVGGRRAVRARTPNAGYFRVESAGPDNRTSFVAATSEAQTLAQPTAAEVALLHDWSMSRVRLAAIDAATRTYRMAAPLGANQPQFAITNFEPHPRYFLENAQELLDAPGEWFLDEAAGQVHYLPREGETPDTAHAMAPRLEQLLVVRGDAERSVENLVFRGITFSHTRFELPPYGYVGVQSSWHSRRSAPDDDEGVTMIAAVELDGARRCGFEDCTFERLAACGLHFIHCEDCRLDRTTVRDIGGDGVMIGSRRQADAATSRITVEGCLVERCGATFYGAVGLWLGFADACAVTHNELRHLPYSGVSVGWQWDDAPTTVRAHRIDRNHIHHVMQELSDGGGIYTLGRQPGTVLSQNLIHDVPAGPGRAESNGIFMDQGSSEIVVRDNTIYNVGNSPIRFHMAGPNEIVGNRLVARPGVPVFSSLATDMAAIAIRDNAEVVAAVWTPPGDDPALQAAGRRTDAKDSLSR